MSHTPEQMSGVLLTGHGGPEKLQYRTDIPVPVPGPGEMLIRVAAAGVNNTDINTRTGWYSKSVTTATDTTGETYADAPDAGWSGSAIAFPRIQGADVCGHVAAVGDGVNPDRVNERVLVRTMLRAHHSEHQNNTDRPDECWTLGSDCDGGFAQYVVAPAHETYAARCDWSDAELASIPCSYSTAENMLHRAKVGTETVLIGGASGGVGSAAVQLAKRRGATVIAMTSPHKADDLYALGADRVIDRDADLVDVLGRDSVDVVIDMVGGESWAAFLDVLTRGGRYAIAGAIGGPLTRIDLRTLYLKDLTLLGCTFQEEVVFTNLIRYIERGEIRPLVAATYPLQDINRAQEDFSRKRHTGKLVLIP